MSPSIPLVSLLIALFPWNAVGASESAAAAASPPGLAIQGILLGQSFQQLDDRFHLSDRDSIERDGKRLYIWTPPLNLRSEALPGFTGQVPQALRLLFDGDRVVEVDATYSSKARFARTGLVELYGEPTSIVAPPPQRSRRRENSGYLARPVESEGGAGWLQIWRWEREEATLTVTGRHYTTRNAGRPARGSHIFHFRLTGPDPDR